MAGASNKGTLTLAIAETFIHDVLSAIARDRPEVWSTYSKGYQKSVGEPWNRNDPEPSVEIGSDGILDYFVSCPGPTATLSSNEITIAIDFSTRFQVASKGQKPQEIQWNSSIGACLGFGELDPSSKGYPVTLRDFNLQVDLPPGLAELLDWVLTQLLGAAISRALVLPEKLALDSGTPYSVRLSRPSITSERTITVSGQLE